MATCTGRFGEENGSCLGEKLCPALPKQVLSKPLERFQVRSLLHILKKEKSGGEGVTYGSLDEIMELFNQELESHQAHVVASSASSASGGSVPQALTMDQAKDPMFLASLKLKLEVDEVCTHKNHPGSSSRF